MSANHRFETLMDVSRRGMGMEVVCGCGRRRVVDGTMLWRLFIQRGWDFRVISVAQRMRCTACGAIARSARVSGRRD